MGVLRFSADLLHVNGQMMTDASVKTIAILEAAIRTAAPEVKENPSRPSRETLFEFHVAEREKLFFHCASVPKLTK